MNKLITTELGGHPLTLDDLEFIQSAYREAFAGLLLGLSEQNNRGFRLTGCELYLNTVTNTMWLSQGYVVVKVGNMTEIYHVPDHNLGVASFSADPFWKYEEKDVAPSPVTYKNLNQKYVHKKGTLTLSPTFQTFLFPRYSDTPLWEHALKNWLWKPRVHFNNLNSWAPGINPVPNGSYSVEGKRVFMSGDIRYTGATLPTVNQPFTILPPEVRPAESHMFNCLVTLGWDDTKNELKTEPHAIAKQMAWVRIQTDGRCFAERINHTGSYIGFSANASILLDGVSWLLP